MWRTLFLLGVWQLPSIHGEAPQQPTSECHIKITSVSLGYDTAMIEVNGNMIGSINADMYADQSDTGGNRFLGVLLGPNCLPLQFAHIYFYADDFFQGSLYAPQGTIMAMALVDVMFVWSIALGAPILVNAYPFLFLRALGLKFYSDGEADTAYKSFSHYYYAPEYYYNEKFDADKFQGSISIVAKKGYPEQTEARVMSSLTHSRDHTYTVVTERECRSPLPPPELVGSPAHHEAHHFNIQAAVYDRLWCGGEVYAWEYLPNAQGEVYFGLWAIDEQLASVLPNVEVVHGVLKASTMVYTEGPSEKVHYKCLAPHERLRADFGDVYGIHYSNKYSQPERRKKRHIPSVGHMHSAIQILECHEDAPVCRQFEPFPCGRVATMSDVDLILISTDMHEDVVNQQGITSFTRVELRTLAVRPVLDPDFVYTCGCLSDEECMKGGDVHMVCQDDRTCACREHYVYSRKANRCGKELAHHAKSVWHRSTLNWYTASLAVDRDDDPYGESCSYTDPYDVKSFEGMREKREIIEIKPDSDDAEENQQAENALGRRSRRPLLKRNNDGEQIRQKTLLEERAKRPFLASVDTSQTPAGRRQTAQNQKRGQKSGQGIKPTPDESFIKPLHGSSHNGTSRTGEKEATQMWIIYDADGKALRAPWFVVDMGYENYVQSVTLTPPAIFDDHLGLSNGNKVLTIRDDLADTEFVKESTHAHVKGFSYWLLFEDTDFNGAYSLFGPVHSHLEEEHNLHYDYEHGIGHDHGDDHHHGLHFHGDELTGEEDIGHHHDDDHHDHHHHDDDYHDDHDDDHEDDHHHYPDKMSGHVGQVGSVRYVGDDIICLKHDPSGLYIHVSEKGELVLGEKCEDYFYFHIDGTAFHAQSCRPLHANIDLPGQVIHLGSMHMGFTTSLFPITLNMDAPYKILVGNPLSGICLGAGLGAGIGAEKAQVGAKVGAKVIIEEFDDCISWTAQYALKHKLRYEEVETVSVDVDENGRANLAVKSKHMELLTENPACFEAYAKDQSGHILPQLEINNVAFQDAPLNTVEVFGIEPEEEQIFITYAMSEPSDAGLDRFEILVTNDLDPENAPVSHDSMRCKRYYGSLKEGKTTTIACDKVLAGRYLVISKYQVISNYYHNMLSLCDIEIHGSAVYMHHSDCDSDEECEAHGDHQLMCDHHMCACNIGYYYPSKETDFCVDVDECLHSPCSHKCVNMIGSYRCECPHGMVLMPDKHTCIDDNECEVDNSMCEQRCQNYERGEGYFCSCYVGYELENNQHSCRDIDECALTINPCIHDRYATCVNTPGSCKCLCPYEEHGVHWDGRACIAKDAESFCDVENGLCEHRCHYDGHYFFNVECSCEEGYDLAEDGRSCLGASHCVDANGGCMHSCHIGEEDAIVCDCYHGYQIMADGRNCHDIDECTISNGGCMDTCVNTPGGRKCLCTGATVPFSGGAKCVSGLLSVVYEFRLNGEWSPALRDMNTAMARGLAELIVAQVAFAVRDSPLDEHMDGHELNKKATFEIVEFFKHDIGVRLGGIFDHELSLMERAEAMLAMLYRINTLSVHTHDNTKLAVTGNVGYIDITTGGLTQTHILHVACDVYRVLDVCMNGAHCEEELARPYCVCAGKYSGWRCDHMPLQFDPLTDTEFFMVIAAAILVLLLLVIIVVAVCYRTRSSPVIVKPALPACTAPAVVNPYGMYPEPMDNLAQYINPLNYYKQFVGTPASTQCVTVLPPAQTECTTMIPPATTQCTTTLPSLESGQIYQTDPNLPVLTYY